MFFTLPPGTYHCQQCLWISFSETNVPIHYRLDDQEPTDADPVFDPTQPICIDGTVIITAKACSAFYEFATVESAVYDFQVGALTVTPASPVPRHTVVVISSATPDAALEVSFDPVPLDLASNWSAFSGTVEIGSNVTFHVRASKEGYQPTAQTFDFQIARLPLSQFSPSPGVPFDSPTVSISNSMPAAMLYYTREALVRVETNTTVCLTVEPCTPVPGLIAYPAHPAWVPYTEPIALQSNAVLWAKAEHPDYLASYSCGAFEMPLLPRPEFNPSRDPITNGTLVSITCLVAGASLRYTLDGTEPTLDADEYSTPLEISGNSRLKARAFKAGYNPSFVRYTYYRASSNSPPFCSNSSWELPHLIVTNVSAADRPVWITHAGDGSGRLFFLEEPGVVRIVGNTTPFLDFGRLAQNFPPCTFVDPADPIGPAIPAFVVRNIRGVGLAFPPHYDSKAYFYVSYFDGGGLVVSRFTALANPEEADSNSEYRVTNLFNIGCNGGQLVFSADGTLYVNSGGPIVTGTPTGSQGDLAGLAGKMIPILNEEGLPITNQVTTTNWPFAEQFSADSCSIIGGVLDRSQQCRMSGLYFYADSLSYRGQRFGRIWALKPAGTGWEPYLLASPYFNVGFVPEFPDRRPFRITAYGQDELGRTYVANYGATIYYQVPPDFHAVSAIVGGGIYRIDDNPAVFSVRAKVQAGQGVAFEWQSASDLAYQPEVSGDLIDWTALGPTLPGTGALLSVTNVSLTLPAHLFFRVLASPLNLPPEP